MFAFTSSLLLIVVLNLSGRVMAHGKLSIRDADHMKEHLPESVDYNNLTDDDVLFHYFRAHDIEGNNKLDGCELLQSLLHYHTEASATYGSPVRIFSDADLSAIVDSILESDDKNFDGFIDYPEYLSGQMSKGL